MKSSHEWSGKKIVSLLNPCIFAQEFVRNYASIFEIMFAMFFKFRLYILATFLFAGSSQPIDDVPEPARKKNKGKKPIQNSKSNFEIQVQKPCQPNWEHGKIIALVAAKGEEHMANIKEVDGCDQFETAVNKCKNISKAVMEVSYSEHMRNGPACKHKWHTIASDFKKIYGFMACTGNNQDYWTMGVQERIVAHLPQNFGRGIHDMIHEFQGSRPIF